MSLAGIVAKVGGCEGAALDVLDRVEPISEFMILALSDSRDRVPLRYAAQGQLLKLPRQPRGGSAAPGPKYNAPFSAAHGAGLRVSEVVALKVSDVDSERVLLRIEQGEGRRDRFAMLSPQLLDRVGAAAEPARDQIKLLARAIKRLH
jgi:hypothetical protein